MVLPAQHSAVTFFRHVYYAATNSSFYFFLLPKLRLPEGRTYMPFIFLSSEVPTKQFACSGLRPYSMNYIEVIKWGGDRVLEWELFLICVFFTKLRKCSFGGRLFYALIQYHL